MAPGEGRGMGEEENGEVEAPETGLKAYGGFIDFVTQSFYRVSGEMDYLAGEFRDLLLKRSDISENNKTDIAFELGRLEYALYLLKQFYESGPLGNYLDRPDVVKGLVRVISPVMGLYVSLKDGKTEDIHRVLVTIGGASGEIYSIIRDGLEEVEKERC